MSRRLARPPLGALAPDISLQAENGQTWQLADQRGRYTVLIFHRHIH